MRESPDFPGLWLLDHPLIQHRLTLMRRKDTASGEFRRLLLEIGRVMAVDVVRDLPLTQVRIETPLTEMDAPALADGGRLSIVPVLRAGLTMAEGMATLLPAASFGHIGVCRDHDTHLPSEYLVKLPPNEGQPFILVDPMLATGNSAIHAAHVLKRHGVAAENMRFVALVAAPEGVRAFTAAHAGVRVFTAALDSHLNERAYIVPGLGDAGDRLFGTV